MVYTAMTGAQQSLTLQGVISNNLANVSTTGFRGEIAAMRAVPVQGAGELSTRVSTVATTPGADLTAGPVRATGRTMDVAMQGNAWLAVQQPNGSEAYTRDGNLQINADGVLNVNGMPVLGQAGPIIVSPEATVTVMDDGTVNAVAAGSQPNTIAAVGRLKLVTPPAGTRLQRQSDGLFQNVVQGTPVPLPEDGNATVQTGALEGSNVNLVSTLVQMIAAQRLYGMQIKTISTADSDSQTANSILTLGA